VEEVLLLVMVFAVGVAAGANEGRDRDSIRSENHWNRNQSKACLIASVGHQRVQQRRRVEAWPVTSGIVQESCQGCTSNLARQARLGWGQVYGF